MNSVVLELQRDTLAKSVATSELLRKAYVVARKLGIEEFKEWASSELGGYEAADDVPDYRFIDGEVKAWNPYHGWQPVHFEDYEMEQAASRRPCRQAIAEIESLVNADDRSGSLQMPFSRRTERKLSEAIGFDTQVTMMAPSTALVRIVDSVRTVILNWSLKLEEDGILGDGVSFSSGEKEAAKKTSYNINNFYGSVESAQIQQESQGSLQSLESHPVDLGALRGLLERITESLDEISIDAETAGELSAEIQTLKAQTISPRPKQSIIKEGIVSLRRILEGAGGGVAAQLLTQLISLLK